MCVGYIEKRSNSGIKINSLKIRCTKLNRGNNSVPLS